MTIIKRLLTVSFLVLLLSVLGLSAFVQAGQVTRQNTLVFAQSAEVVSIDPLNPIGYPAGYEVVMLVYDQLVRLNEDLSISPELAKRWEVSPDGLTWTFYLRTDVKFHDGTPFTAHDVKAHIDRARDPVVGSANRTLFDHIIAANVIDEYTIQLVTEKPFGPMLYYLAHGSGGICGPIKGSKEIIDTGKTLDTIPIGTGPYKVLSFVPGVEVVVIKNENYWGPTPGFEQVIFKRVYDASVRVAMLRTGEADVANDIVPESVTELRSDSNTKVISQTSLRTFGLGFNFDVTPFDDPRVREAINYAIDKEAITKSLFLGYAKSLTSPLSSAIFGHKDVKFYEYDPKKALALLAESGWVPGPDGVLQKDGRRFKTTILTSEGEYPKDLEVVQAIQSYLKDIGIDVSIWKVEQAAVRSYRKAPRKEAQYEMFFFGFNPSNGDPSYHLISLYETNPDPEGAPYRWNMQHYSNPELDQLIESSLQGLSAIDPEKRRELLVSAQKILVEDNPYAWLYTPDLLVGVRSNVEGIQVLPTIFIGLRKAYRH